MYNGKLVTWSGDERGISHHLHLHRQEKWPYIFLIVNYMKWSLLTNHTYIRWDCYTVSTVTFAFHLCITYQMLLFSQQNCHSKRYVFHSYGLLSYLKVIKHSINVNLLITLKQISSRAVSWKPLEHPRTKEWCHPFNTYTCVTRFTWFEQSHYFPSSCLLLNWLLWFRYNDIIWDWKGFY